MGGAPLRGLVSSSPVEGGSHRYDANAAQYRPTLASLRAVRMERRRGEVPRVWRSRGHGRGRRSRVRAAALAEHLEHGASDMGRLPGGLRGAENLAHYLPRARGSPGSRGAAPADVALPKNDAPTLDP